MNVGDDIHAPSKGAAANAAKTLHTSWDQGGSEPSEKVMAEMFRQDIGVTIEPQALRMFIRYRFGRLSVLAHRIHEGKS